jgi:DNA repair protein SbcC/Rad50
MRITSVALENIKSYQKVEVRFSSGTSAIRGHNGAGKSTLVEAIGFALFDALNYSQDQFVREGERYGQVTVSFLSAEDDREYQAVRRCGSSPTWYIYDPELQMRVVEQKIDVNDFLRRHLRIETEISLRDLFNDALGIPQGTFTADFLLSPANRKKKFDTLLQIEDYRKAAEKLSETRGYLQEERRTIEMRISELERETSQLEGWRNDLAQRRLQQKDIVSRQQELERESAEVEKVCTSLREQRNRIQMLENEVKLAHAAYSAADQRQEQALRLLEEARMASRTCDAARGDYQRYLAAREQHDRASQRSLLRDELERKRAVVAQQHAATDRDLQNARQRLEEACQAETRVRDLAPLVARQTALEQERDAARRQMERSEEAALHLEEVRQLVQQCLVEIQRCEQVIATLELSGPAAALLDQRREHLAMLRDQRAQQSERKKRLTKITLEQREEIATLKTATANEARLEENVHKILAKQSVAEGLPALEERCRSLEVQLREIETRREQHRRSSNASEGGNCPFLKEPCLNIQRKGVSSLSNYFDQLIAEEDQALQSTRDQLAQVEQKRDQAREVRRYYDRLDLYQQQLASATEQRMSAETRLTKLAEEQVEIENLERNTPGAEEIAQAHQLFKESDEADKQLREIEPRRAELAILKTQHGNSSREVKKLEETVADIEPVRVKLSSIEKELITLEDPRSLHTRLQHAAGERSLHQAKVDALQRQTRDLSTNLAGIEKQLQPFASLEKEIDRLRRECDQRQPGYQQYLQYEKLAEQLPARDEESRRTTKAAAAARQLLAKAQSAYRDAGATFDEEKLKRAELRSKELKDEVSTKRAELSFQLERSQELESKIAQVEALQPQLSAERNERSTTEQLELMLQHFRDLIREAGPNIMRALLREISIQANRIFGEIMGDHSAELAWTNDYEIVLYKNGQERSFAQLSGGEQMSAALAVRLALLRRLSRLDIAFFDEPTQNMDGERRGNLAEQIRRVRGFDQLIVISHDDTFEQGLDSVIHLEKRDGKTVLIEDDMLVPA